MALVGTVSFVVYFIANASQSTFDNTTNKDSQAVDALLGNQTMVTGLWGGGLLLGLSGMVFSHGSSCNDTFLSFYPLLFVLGCPLFGSERLLLVHPMQNVRWVRWIAQDLHGGSLCSQSVR